MGDSTRTTPQSAGSVNDSAPAPSADNKPTPGMLRGLSKIAADLAAYRNGTAPSAEPPATDAPCSSCGQTAGFHTLRCRDKNAASELRATHCSNEGLHDYAADLIERQAREIAEHNQPVPLSEWQQLVAERDALRECVRAADGQLSRVLHELAGSASLCWEPKPTGAFHSTQACEFVAAAIDELRAILRGDAASAKGKP